MPSKKPTPNEIKRWVPDWKAADQSWRVEAWIIIALVQRKAARQGEITAGWTDFNERRERIRRSIIAANLIEVPMGKVGKIKHCAETFGSIFARFYREPLIKP
jgi:hypothetical protein